MLLMQSKHHTLALKPLRTTHLYLVSTCQDDLVLSHLCLGSGHGGHREGVGVQVRHHGVHHDFRGGGSQ